MKSTKTIISCCLAALCLLVSPVRAGDKKFSLGINAGLDIWPSDNCSYIQLYALPTLPPYSEVSTWESKVRMKNHFNFHLQYNFNPRFGLQGEFGLYRAKFRSLISIKIYGEKPKEMHDTPGFSWNISTFFLNAIFQMTTARESLAAFGSLGAGFCYINQASAQGQYIGAGTRSTVDVAIKGGGGFVYFPTNKIPLGLNLRAFLVMIGSSPTSQYYQFWGTDPVAEGTDLILGFDIGLKFIL